MSDSKAHCTRCSISRSVAEISEFLGAENKRDESPSCTRCEKKLSTLIKEVRSIHKQASHSLKNHLFPDREA